MKQTFPQAAFDYLVCVDSYLFSLTEYIHSPIMVMFPDIVEQFDLMDVLRVWQFYFLYDRKNKENVS